MRISLKKLEQTCKDKVGALVNSKAITMMFSVYHPNAFEFDNIPRSKVNFG